MVLDNDDEDNIVTYDIAVFIVFMANDTSHIPMRRKVIDTIRLTLIMSNYKRQRVSQIGPVGPTELVVH